MIFVFIMLVALILILLGLLILYRREVYHLLMQLNQIDDGSSIELRSNIRKHIFLLLYGKLNRIFRTFRLKEQKYMRTQEQLKQSISNIAHDIRTPLTSALGYLQMLQDCTESDKQLRYEHIIEKRLDELKYMLEELFLYTTLASDDNSPDCRSTAVFPVLSDCMVGLYQVFEEKQIEPDIRFEDENIAVMATPEILGRLFRNLISNALLHGNGGLSIVQNGSVLTFTNPVKTADTIDTARLFARFYKADPSRRAGSSGLGLAIVKELVQKTGGSVNASIEDGRMLRIKIAFRPVLQRE